MVSGINVDITILNNDTGQYYRVPVLPEEIPYSDGDAIKDTIKIIDLGSVDFHSGVELDSMEWSSFFPVRYDPGYCTTSDLLTPIEYRDLFSTWKDQATSLQLICPAAGINKNMTLNSFKWQLQGFEGDIYYTVQFKEKKVLRPVQVALAAAIPQQAKPGPQNREPIPQKAKPATYTVNAGDTLTFIAKKIPVTTGWKTLYEKNKAVIGTNPSLIKVGQVLTV